MNQIGLVAHISLLWGYVGHLPALRLRDSRTTNTLHPAGRNNRSPARQSRVRARSEPSPIRSANETE